MKLLILLSAFVVATHASSDGDWTYDPSSDHGPAHWPDDCVLETSTRQSPIDIDTADPVEDSFDAFNLEHYDDLKARIFNTGSTVEVEIEHEEGEDSPILSGGDLPGNYRLAQFHWHWGSNNNDGSEHQINGVPASMEVHFVHVKDGSHSGPALAVLSWLIKVDVDSNSAFSDREDEYEDLFEDRIENVVEPSSEEEIDDLDAEDYMGDTDGAFFRYNGSLTTPPCTESVIWTVFKDPILIDQDELDELRNVKSTRSFNPAKGLASDNNRPIQARNGRKIILYQ